MQAPLSRRNVAQETHPDIPDPELAALARYLREIRFPDHTVQAELVAESWRYKESRPQLGRALWRVAELVEGLNWEASFASVLHWPTCRQWIVAEACASCGVLLPELAQLRATFERDRNGEPQIQTIMFDRREKAFHTAEVHYGLMRAEAYCGTDSHPATFWYEATNNAVGPAYDYCMKYGIRHTNIDTPYQPHLNGVKPLVDEAFARYMFHHPELQLPSVRHLNPDVKQSLAKSLRPSLHTDHYLLPKSFWNDAYELQMMYHQDGYEGRHFESAIAPDELKAFMQRKSVFCIATRWDGLLVAMDLLIVGEENFLPQTHAKLAQLPPNVLPDTSVHAWHAMTVCRPDAIVTLARRGLDLYRFTADLKEQVLLAEGCDNVAAIVDQRNPAALSHPRVGYETIAGRMTFPTDDGGEGRCIAADLRPKPN